MTKHTDPQNTQVFLRLSVELTMEEATRMLHLVRAGYGRRLRNPVLGARYFLERVIDNARVGLWDESGEAD